MGDVRKNVEVLRMLGTYFDKEIPKPAKQCAGREAIRFDDPEPLGREFDRLEQQRQEDFVFALEIPKKRRLREFATFGYLFGRRAVEPVFAHKRSSGPKHGASAGFSFARAAFLNSHIALPQIPCDRLALDFAGAFAPIQYLAIAVIALGRAFHHVALRSTQVQGAFADPGARFRRKQFGH